MVRISWKNKKIVFKWLDKSIKNEEIVQKMSLRNLLEKIV